MLKIRSRAAVLMLSIPLLAACGSSGGGSGTSPSTQNTTAPSASTSFPTTAPSGATFSASCPSVAVVDAALAQHDQAPVSTPQAFGLTCTYQGSGVVPTKVEFEQTTETAFAAGEQGVTTSGLKATKVSGLGDAAYETSGFIDVLNGTESIKVVSPFSTPAQLQALARQIIG